MKENLEEQMRLDAMVKRTAFQGFYETTLNWAELACLFTKRQDSHSTIRQPYALGIGEVINCCHFKFAVYYDE